MKAVCCAATRSQTWFSCKNRSRKKLPVVENRGNEMVRRSDQPCPPEKNADCFPAEKVQFKPSGN
jgi:hypothetical protein